MPQLTNYYIGLMSGTSLDGVDAVLIQMQNERFIQASHHAYVPYPDSIKARVLALQDASFDELHTSHVLAQDLSRLYAKAVHNLLQLANKQPSDISAIGCHGQTIRHRPDAAYSIQIADYPLLAQLSQINVVGDFRSRDLAAGGQGAPLVPAFHHAVFSDATEKRVLLNIGGIANVSILNVPEVAIGFDTGPGNMLMDAWVKHHWQQDYDKDALLARQGKVLPDLLHALLKHGYFAQDIPKSTGRDLFSFLWLQQYLTGIENPYDVLRTLLELTAKSIADATLQHAPKHDAVYLCGGGIYNPLLIEQLQYHLPHMRIDSTDSLLLNPQWMEAAAFAWLAACWHLRIPSNMPSVTGANRPCILGAGYYA